MRASYPRLRRAGVGAIVALAFAIPQGITSAHAAQLNNVIGSCAFTSPDSECSYTSIGGAESIITIGNSAAPVIIGGLFGGPLSPPLPSACTLLGIVSGTTVGPFTEGPVTIGQITFGGAIVGPVWLCQVNQSLNATITVQAPGAIVGIASPL